MNKWLGDGPNAIPHFASHTIGVGGVVLHPDCKSILMIKEKFWFTGKEPTWKFPGGLVDVHEDLHLAAEREVFEETGIDAEFQGILGLREIPRGFRHEQADIYFPCLLKVRDIKKTLIDMQENELNACEWLPIE